MVVDADVGDLEAGAVGALLMGAGNARADAVKAAELLGLEPRTSASRVTILAHGWCIPDSRCPTYTVEVLLHAATSSCVRSRALRLLRSTSPKLCPFARRFDKFNAPRELLARPVAKLPSEAYKYCETNFKEIGTD